MIQTGCATLIIGYMLYISFFDIGDLLGSKSENQGAGPTPTPRPPISSNRRPGASSRKIYLAR